MHILDDPDRSARVRALLSRARRYPMMDSALIKEQAGAVNAQGRAEPASALALEAMPRFEERYGGLWYPVIGSNGMEHGLQGEPIVEAGTHGWTIRSGIIDGDHTWPLDVLLDGRTVMTLAEKPRIINSSVAQRLEAHAQLVLVRSWPHVTLRTTTERHADPEVASLDIATPDTEATGPADRWWTADGIAIHLELDTWWNARDTWHVRCFAQRESDLPTVVRTAQRMISGTIARAIVNTCGSVASQRREDRSRVSPSTAASSESRGWASAGAVTMRRTDTSGWSSSRRSSSPSSPGTAFGWTLMRDASARVARK
ncbi:hypothetical protein [Streptacidiphilus rugosus]|uniref:hypothetical protein n=1 Tax=Streptacidiphilus rugosus TaxID=405783 RepID=UPI0012FB63EA|nr:hypothetical protein [Streptacidiphilus rugosus]